MKRFISMLLASVMTFSTFGMVAFADDGQQEESASGNQKAQTQSVAKESKVAVQDINETYDLSSCKFFLEKKSFTCDPSKGKSGEFNDNFATVGSILEHLECETIPEGAGGLNDIYENCTFKIGNASYKYYDDDKNYNTYLNAGKYKLIISAKTPNTGRVELPFEVLPYKVNSKNGSVGELNHVSYTYNGKSKKPKVTGVYVTPEDTEKSLEPKIGRDCTVSYQYKKNRKVGVSKVIITVKFKGNYTGSFKDTTYFWIWPQPTKIKSIKAGKRTATIKWKKKKGATGYSVFIFKKNKIVKEKFFKGSKKTTCKVTGLKRRTKYRVEVVTFKGKWDAQSKFKTFRTK